MVTVKSFSAFNHLRHVLRQLMAINVKPTQNQVKQYVQLNILCAMADTNCLSIYYYFTYMFTLKLMENFFQAILAQAVHDTDSYTSVIFRPQNLYCLASIHLYFVSFQ